MWLESTTHKPPQNNKYIDFQLMGVAASSQQKRGKIWNVPRGSDGIT